MKLMSAKSNDVPLKVQCLYALLYVGAVFCALWLQGEPDLMFGVMIAAPFMVLLSRIPMGCFRRSCGSWPRSRSVPRHSSG